VLEPPTTSTPSSLVGIEPNLLAKIKSHVEATATLKKSITEHHESVSRDILEIKQAIKDIEKREIDTRVPQRLTDLERRLSSTTGPTPSMSMAASGVDLDTIKNEILEVVEEKQAAMDDVVQSISSQWQTAIKDNQIRCTNLEQRCSDIKALYDSLAALPNKLETFQKSLNITIRQQQTDIDDTKLNMAGKVADLLRAKPELLPLAPIGDLVVKRFDDKLSKLAKSQQDLTQAVNERLEANTDGLISIDRRLNNINTKDMAVYVLAQMESTYPDVRNAQSALVELKTSLHRDESMIGDLNTSLAALKNQVDTLKTRVSQNDHDEKAIQSLRSEVDDLILQVPQIRNVANSAKETADTANDNIATIQTDFNKFQTEIAEEVGKFRIDLEEMKDQQQAKATSAPPASVHSNKQSAIPPPIPPQRQSVILPPRSILNGNARSSPKNSAPGTPQRHSSVQSDSTSKKRKLNGSSTNTPKGANGVNGAKRKRKYRLDGDDSEDSTFEPNQPKISDDDED
jgi:chromosome segregation ATPase